MKKIITQLLYVFSFSLLFVALYLNLVQLNQPDASAAKAEKKMAQPGNVIGKSSAVAQPGNNTVLK